MEQVCQLLGTFEELTKCPRTVEKSSGKNVVGGKPFELTSVFNSMVA